MEIEHGILLLAQSFDIQSLVKQLYDSGEMAINLNGKIKYIDNRGADRIDNYCKEWIKQQFNTMIVFFGMTGDDTDELFSHFLPLFRIERLIKDARRWVFRCWEHNNNYPAIMMVIDFRDYLLILNRTFHTTMKYRRPEWVNREFLLYPYDEKRTRHE